MKIISNLVFEIKTGKLSKQKAANLLNAHKLGKIYVLKNKSTATRVVSEEIAGHVKSFIPLNNKTIVRVAFDTRDDINTAEFDFHQLNNGEYVLMPVK